VLLHVACNQAAVGVVIAPRVGRDDIGDRFVLEKTRSRVLGGDPVTCFAKIVAENVEFEDIYYCDRSNNDAEE
jgi:hypothetical protein